MAMIDSNECVDLSRFEGLLSPVDPAREPSSVARAVGPQNRNGYATVVGNVLQLIRAKRHLAITPRIALSVADETKLREGDEQQLGPSGAVLAAADAKPEWRAFVRTHFQRRFGVGVVFDSPETKLQ
jgi:hypothetical protein